MKKILTLALVFTLSSGFSAVAQYHHDQEPPREAVQHHKKAAPAPQVKKHASRPAKGKVFYKRPGHGKYVKYNHKKCWYSNGVYYRILKDKRGRTYYKVYAYRR